MSDHDQLVRRCEYLRPALNASLSFARAAPVGLITGDLECPRCGAPASIVEEVLLFCPECDEAFDYPVRPDWDEASE